MRPRLLDLFCGAGGAAMGYHCAGFDVVGVDIKPQPHYPFEFHQGDALEWLEGGRAFVVGDQGFDAVHASPPCQAFSAMRVMGNARIHADLLTPTRTLLLSLGLPWVIENVPQAPLDTEAEDLFGKAGGIVLCGSMFGLRTDAYELRRHRLFEASTPLPRMACRHSQRQVVGFYGDHARMRTRIDGHHARGTDVTRGDDKLALIRDLMDIDWMTWPEATQAIPPAYTEFVGSQLIRQLVTAQREGVA